MRGQSKRPHAFLVSRVSYGGDAPRYRCIGALQDRWCHNSIPLISALRFFRLIKQPQNAEIIRMELHELGSFGSQLDEYHVVPCPFSQFLFLCGWSVILDDHENPVATRSCRLVEDFGPRFGESRSYNEGITVIDITNPEEPTCCFKVDIYDSGRAPMSAAEYLHCYGPARYGDPENLIRSFDAIPVMSQEVINESFSIGENHSKCLPVHCPTPIENRIPSLFKLILRPAIDQAISSANTHILPWILVDEERMSIAKDVIRSHSRLVPDGALGLLRGLISVCKAKCLDLSGFPLSGRQIIQFFSFFEDAEVRALNLSRNTFLTIADLEHILEETPKSLRRLVLFNTSITDAEITGLLRTRPKLFYHLESIVHPAFLSEMYKSGPTEFFHAFTHRMMGDIDGSAWSVSLPFFTPNTIAQGLADYLRGFNYAHTLGGREDAMAAYASTSRTSEIPWQERSVNYLPRWDDGSREARLRVDEWLFLVTPDRENWHIHSRRCFYAFIRANERGRAFLKGSHKAKHKIKILYRPALIEIYDFRGFFKELQCEGRPPPDPSILEQLFNLFSVNENNEEVFSFMDHEKIVETLKFKSTSEDTATRRSV